ncbi:MAG: hypothetical protein MUF42_06130 [Cytophagaceae bacterium]|jgi:hypothetical protein|nr:hypothetical protein [Cytophagaceae bacterium]
MKKLLVLVPILFVLLSSCKKKSDKEEEVKVDPPKQSDAAGSAEVDEAVDQVNDVINNKIGGGSNVRVAAYNLPCGVVSVDSSTTQNGKKVYKMNYGNRTKCGYKYKSGEISFTLKSGNAFNEVGAVFRTTFTDYVVEVLANGALVKLNGYLEVTNVDGGFVWQAVTSNATIKHKMRGTLQITYANGETRVRKYYQMRTYSNSNTPSNWAGLRLSIAGDSVDVNNSAITISETGKTYEGNYDFYTEISTAFLWSNCGTTWAGPYVLKDGNARLNVIVPLVSPAYIDIAAGFNWDGTSATATEVNDCNASAYKISTTIGTASATTYQLY